MNYYNEFDPFAASWLNKLIEGGHIPQGFVDTRSITEVEANELKKYTQCHFFSGIGGWSRALQLAGWPTDRTVWTGSCPCQPFSSAGNQKGKSDERHLWPVWFNLIRECRPPTIFGEQVSSSIAHGWLDDVYQGLEAEGYACGSAVLPSCSVGAPHKRDRLFFVANTSVNGWGQGNTDARGRRTGVCAEQRPMFGNNSESDVANTERVYAQGCENRQGQVEHWGNSAWIDCPDGKQRLIEPSIRLLANGVSNRVGKLRGYGNAIVPAVAAKFIEAYMQGETK